MLEKSKKDKWIRFENFTRSHVHKVDFKYLMLQQRAALLKTKDPFLATMEWMKLAYLAER